jgi:hypothetical protein
MVEEEGKSTPERTRKSAVIAVRAEANERPMRDLLLDAQKILR